MGSGVQARLLRGARHLENALFGLILCFCRLEVLNHFLTRGPPFSFCSGPCKLCSWSWVQATWGSDILPQLAFELVFEFAAD